MSYPPDEIEEEAHWTLRKLEGIGHTSWVPAQRPSMGVMLNTQGEPRDGNIPRTGVNASRLFVEDSGRRCYWRLISIEVFSSVTGNLAWSKLGGPIRPMASLLKP